MQDEYGARSEQVFVFTERTLRQEGGTKYKVAEVIIHPKRDPVPKTFDQALLRLERSIKVSDRARPICFPGGLYSSQISVFFFFIKADIKS